MKALNKSRSEFKITEPFKNLFTQGMVCHETYKDKNGNWLYPEEIEKIDDRSVIKKIDKSKVIVGPQESMSKSKKNTVDPETMIQQYGADAVRWFILSDSPPEKDVQWSDTGVASANKFLQRIWNLNFAISKRKSKSADKKVEDLFKTKINNYIGKIDTSIKNFRFNVSIANFYEIYKVFKEFENKDLDNNVLLENLISIMKLMIPFTPHLAYECLELLNCKYPNDWPKIDSRYSQDQIKLAIQVNGKTRDIINIKKNTEQDDVNKTVLVKSKAKKFIDGKKIIKTIFVKNKIINYII